VYNGWPLIVGVTIMNANAYEANIPVTLLPNWKNSIHFIVQDTAGNRYTWPLHIVNPGDENITLDSLTYASVGYWLDTNETTLIPVGDYECIAVLDSTAYSTPGDSVPSASKTITISNAPSTLSVEQKTERDLLLANLSILQGNTASALEHLNEILGYDPNNITALSLIGTLLENEGDLGGALQAYNKGVSGFYQANPNPVEPPFELLHTQNAFYNKLNSAVSFVVTFSAKDTTHPAYGHGSSFCYYVDNIPFRELQLTRGKTYAFHMKNISPTDPFYFSTNAKGGGPEPYTDGVTGAPADSNGIATITVTSNAPDVLYYQSALSEYVGWRIRVTDSTQVTSVHDIHSSIPKEYSLSEAYPNPFNPTTTITYALPMTSHVILKIYNVLGQEVTDLGNEEKVAGVYSIQWNANRFSSGVYFYRLEAISTTDPLRYFAQVRKMLLLK
jgi:tetratricopeptide (TPR) repeat protein